jgi:DNA replication protein DnaC
MDCEICHGTRWKSVTVDGVERLTRCDCWRSVVIQKNLADARIPPKFARAELTTYKPDTDSQRDALRLAKKFVESFPVEQKGLVFHGPTGVGKTHLAIGLLKAVIRDKGARGYFFQTTELLRLVRETYNRSVDETEMEVLRPVLEADVLVLDDLGVEKTSEWVQETLGHVVNIRYSERRPTVFTTNLVESDDPLHPRSFMFRLGARTRSRLFEMCDWIQMDAIDAREVGGPDATPDQIQRWQKHSPASPKNVERSRGQFPAKSTGQLRAEPRIPRDKDGKADLKWPGGRAGSQ